MLHLSSTDVLPNKMKLGIDIGGVIIDRINDDTDTSFFSENFRKTTAVPHAFEVIKRLREHFNGQVVVVSKCGNTNQNKSIIWMEHNGFWDATGLRPKDIFFCLHRIDKAPICQRLGVTHYVDDRMTVLNHLKTVDYKYLFAPSQEELLVPAKKSHHGVKLVYTWDALEGRIKEDR